MTCSTQSSPGILSRSGHAMLNPVISRYSQQIWACHAQPSHLQVFSANLGMPCSTQSSTGILLVKDRNPSSGLCIALSLFMNNSRLSRYSPFHLLKTYLRSLMCQSVRRSILSCCGRVGTGRRHARAGGAGGQQSLAGGLSRGPHNGEQSVQLPVKL